MRNSPARVAGMYDIWRREREAWLGGPRAVIDYVLPDAIICAPPQFPIQRFEDVLLAAESAKPFESVEFTERAFLDKGSTRIVTYRAAAKHQRYRGVYHAVCSTVYILEQGGWMVAHHSHTRLKRGE